MNKYCVQLKECLTLEEANEFMKTLQVVDIRRIHRIESIYVIEYIAVQTTYTPVGNCS